MPGISIHVVDVASGRVARGMRVEVSFAAAGETIFSPLADGRISERGTLDEAALAQRFPAGRVEVLFHVGDWYRAGGQRLPDPAFLDVVRFDFGLATPDEHYHLPFKCTPWGFSCFRGGA